MHAEHDAALAVLGGALEHALVLARHQHGQQHAVGEGVVGVPARERGVGGEPAERRRIEDVVQRRRHLDRARGAVDVLAGALVGDAVGDVVDAVGRVGQAVEGRQRVAGGRHGRHGHVVRRRGARVGGGAVGEVVLGDAEVAAGEAVGARQQAVGRRQRPGRRRAGADAGLIDRAELRAEAADRLQRGQPSGALHRLQRQAAGEVVGRADGERAAVGQRDRRGAARQRLVADGELLPRDGRTLVQRHGLGEVGRKRRLTDRRRVQAEVRRQQVQHVDVRRRGVGRGCARAGSAGCTRASYRSGAEASAAGRARAASRRARDRRCRRRSGH